MKTRTLRNAISIALLVAATGTGEWAMAQNTTTDTATQDRAPVTKAPAKPQPKKSTDKSAAPAATNLQTVTVTGTRIRGGSTPSPVITIGTIPHILVVGANQPYRSVAELLAAAKAQPGKLAFASGGTGTILQMQGELLAQQTGSRFIHVPYKGDTPALQDAAKTAIPIVQKHIAKLQDLTKQPG